MPNVPNKPKYPPKSPVKPGEKPQPGQVVFMDVPLVDDSGYYTKHIGTHPWLVLKSDDVCVEAVLCSTGDDPKRGKFNKDKELSLIAHNRYDYMAGNYNLPTEVQYPPFSRDPSHTTIVQTENRQIIPHVMMYKQHAQYACGGEKLVQNEVERIINMSRDGQKVAKDPYDYFAHDDDYWSVDKYVAEHGAQQPNSFHKNIAGSGLGDRTPKPGGDDFEP